VKRGPPLSATRLHGPPCRSWRQRRGQGRVRRRSTLIGDQSASSHVSHVTIMTGQPTTNTQTSYVSYRWLLLTNIEDLLNLCRVLRPRRICDIYDFFAPFINLLTYCANDVTLINPCIGRIEYFLSVAHCNAMSILVRASITCAIAKLLSHKRALSSDNVILSVCLSVCLSLY